MARRFSLSLAVMALGAVFAAPGANAAFGIKNGNRSPAKKIWTHRTSANPVTGITAATKTRRVHGC